MGYIFLSDARNFGQVGKPLQHFLLRLEDLAVLALLALVERQPSVLPLDQCGTSLEHWVPVDRLGHEILAILLLVALPLLDAHCRTNVGSELPLQHEVGLECFLAVHYDDPALLQQLHLDVLHQRSEGPRVVLVDALEEAVARQDLVELFVISERARLQLRDEVVQSVLPQVFLLAEAHPVNFLKPVHVFRCMAEAPRSPLMAHNSVVTN